MPKKNILFIKGTPDDTKVRLKAIQKNGAAVIEHTGSVNIHDYLQSDQFNKSLLILDANPKQEIGGMRFDAVFNQISDPDSHKITLAKLESMFAKLPPQVPLFNRPENIRKTTRDNISQLLQGIERLHVPKTVRIQPMSPSEIYDTIEKEGFSYPVIFRQAGDHGGVSTIRIDDEAEQFYAFALDGRDYYLTQFVEYKEEDLYAKYRLVVVDGEVFLRHVMYAKEWMVHDKNQLEALKARKTLSSRFNKEIKPHIQPIITEIHRRLGLDYFGIDCHIDKEMNLLVFEVNANMNVFIKTQNSVFKKHAEKIHQALVKMLTDERHRLSV